MGHRSGAECATLLGRWDGPDQCEHGESMERLARNLIRPGHGDNVEIIRDDRATFDLAEFLGRPLFAHLSTTSVEGPRDSPLWFLWEDEALWFIVEEGYNTFHLRVREDPRVAVGIVDFDPRKGRLQHVGIRGLGSLEPWDDDRAERLHYRYYSRLDGWNRPPAPQGTKVTGRLPMTLLKVEPNRVVQREQSYGSSVRAWLRERESRN